MKVKISDNIKKAKKKFLILDTALGLIKLSINNQFFFPNSPHACVFLFYDYNNRDPLLKTNTECYIQTDILCYKLF